MTTTIRIHDRAPRRHDSVQFYDAGFQCHLTGVVTRIGAKKITVRISRNGLECEFEPRQLQVITLHTEGEEQ
jgi:hypothetical protein